MPPGRHAKAAKAIAEGKFKDEIIPIPVELKHVDEKGKSRPVPLRSTRMKACVPTRPRVLGKLKPSFKLNGTVTAGNASQTSDGAAAVVVEPGESGRAGTQTAGDFPLLCPQRRRAGNHGRRPGQSDPEGAPHGRHYARRRKTL
ncbi:hypothetical protein VQ056_14520 [Paenibacillus sp. JTLBN-2024]